jgi:2-iminobutanoate/2-iminopropanoate deaminase
MTDFQRFKTGVADQIGRYSDAISYSNTGRTVMTSGTPGLMPDGSVPESFEEEATVAWRNVEAALGKAGATLDDIVNVRTWLIDASDIATYAAVRNRFITSEPTYMLVVVDQMVKPELHVEIEVTAVVNDRDDGQ